MYSVVHCKNCEHEIFYYNPSPHLSQIFKFVPTARWLHTYHYRQLFKNDEEFYSTINNSRVLTRRSETNHSEGEPSSSCGVPIREFLKQERSCDCNKPEKDPNKSYKIFEKN